MVTEYLEEDGSLDMVIDPQEHQTLDMMVAENGVDVPRELGAWRKIVVDGEARKVTCNCEKCNFDGRCFWVDTFESIEFGLRPPSQCSISDDEVAGGKTELLGQPMLSSA